MLVRGDASEEPSRNDQAFTKLEGKLDCITVDVTEILIPRCKRQPRQPRALGNRNAQ